MSYFANFAAALLTAFAVVCLAQLAYPDDPEVITYGSPLIGALAWFAWQGRGDGDDR